MVLASNAPVRTDKESEGPSHAPASALVAASTGKRQDADVASDSSDSIVASPLDSLAIVRVTPNDAIGIGVRRSTRPHKKRKPYCEDFTASAKGQRPGFVGCASLCLLLSTLLSLFAICLIGLTSTDLATLLVWQSNCMTPRVAFAAGLLMVHAAIKIFMSCRCGVHAYFGSCSLENFWFPED